MSIFREIKECITAREVAEGYGLKILDKGMACCPFHDGRHPSMKIDSGFYCFACGAKGDAINYVAKLFSLSQIDAAKKLVKDFNLPLKVYGGKNKKPDIETIRWRKQKRQEEKTVLIKERFRRWKLEQINMLQEASSDIEKIRAHYMRAPPDEIFKSEEYTQAVKAESNIEHCNRFMEHEKQIDHRSYKEQGIERAPMRHEGYAAREIEARGRRI